MNLSQITSASLTSLLLILTAGELAQALSSSASAGCSSKHSLPSGLTPGGPSKNISFVSHGVDRTYRLHLPSTYSATKPAPLYFSFCGATRNASEQESLSQFSNPEFNKDGLAVYPQPINDQHWLSNPAVSEASPNDIDFVLDLLAYLESNYCIDTSRVYAAGKSNGGGLTNLLACNATSAAKFAAFASVSGAYYTDKLATTDCKPGRDTIPFLEFHGLNDTTVPYDGKNGTDAAHSEPTIPTFLEGWVDRNGCTGCETTPVEEDGLFPKGLVDKLSWSCGAGKENVTVHYRENDIGHIWPSTVSNDDCVEIPAQCPDGHYTFNATQVIMEYFAKWTLPS